MIVTSKTSLVNVPKTLDELAVDKFLAGDTDEVSGVTKYYNVGAHIADASAHLSPDDHYNFEHLNEYADTMNSHINKRVQHFDEGGINVTLTKQEVAEHVHESGLKYHFDGYETETEGLAKDSVFNHVRAGEDKHFDDGQKTEVITHVFESDSKHFVDDEKDTVFLHIADSDIHFAKTDEGGLTIETTKNHIDNSGIHFDSEEQKATIVSHPEADDKHFGEDLTKDTVKEHIIIVNEHIADVSAHLNDEEREFFDNLMTGDISMIDGLKLNSIEGSETITISPAIKTGDLAVAQSISAADITATNSVTTENLTVSNIQGTDGDVKIDGVSATTVTVEDTVNAPVIHVDSLDTNSANYIEMPVIKPSEVITAKISFNDSDASITGNESWASINGFNDINSVAITANTFTATQAYTIESDTGVSCTIAQCTEDGKVVLKADTFDIATFNFDTIQANEITAADDIKVTTEDGEISITGLDEDIKKNAADVELLNKAIQQNSEEISRNRDDINDALTALNLSTNAIHKVTGSLDYSAVADTFVNGSTIVIDFDRSIFTEESEMVDIVELLNAIDNKLDKSEELAARVEILVYNGNFNLDAFTTEEPPAFNEGIHAYIFAAPIYRVWSTDMLTSKLIITCYRQDCDTDDTDRKTIFHVTCEQNEFNSGKENDRVYEII